MITVLSLEQLSSITDGGVVVSIVNSASGDVIRKVTIGEMLDQLVVDKAMNISNPDIKLLKIV